MLPDNWKWLLNLKDCAQSTCALQQRRGAFELLWNKECFWQLSALPMTANFYTWKPKTIRMCYIRGLLERRHCTKFGKESLHSSHFTWEATRKWKVKQGWTSCMKKCRCQELLSYAGDISTAFQKKHRCLSIVLMRNWQGLLYSSQAMSISLKARMKKPSR